MVGRPEARRIPTPWLASFRARIRVTPGTRNAATGLAGLVGSPQRGYSFHMAVDPASPGDGVGDIIYFGAARSGEVHQCGRPLRGVDRTHTTRRHALMGICAAARPLLRRLLRQ